MANQVPIADQKPTMRLTVDRIRCCGYGLCVAECREVFELDEDGLARVKLPVIPPELKNDAERAALSCPEEAITMHESGAGTEDER